MSFVLPPWLTASQPAGFRLAWLALWTIFYFAVVTSAKALAPAVQPHCMVGAARCRCVSENKKASNFSLLKGSFGVTAEIAGGVRGSAAGNLNEHASLWAEAHAEAHA